MSGLFLSVNSVHTFRRLSRIVVLGEGEVLMLLMELLVILILFKREQRP